MTSPCEAFAPGMLQLAPTSSGEPTIKLSGTWPAHGQTQPLCNIKFHTIEIKYIIFKTKAAHPQNS